MGEELTSGEIWWQPQLGKMRNPKLELSIWEIIGSGGDVELHRRFTASRAGTMSPTAGCGGGTHNATRKGRPWCRAGAARGGRWTPLRWRGGQGAGGGCVPAGGHAPTGVARSGQSSGGGGAALSSLRAYSSSSPAKVPKYTTLKK